MEARRAASGRAARLLPVFRTRASAFGYTCNGCGRCCRGKEIRVGPYEVARLADYLGLSTEQVLARYVRDNGATLRTTPDGACIFLSGRSCSVHGGRPLVCRMYPLGSVSSSDGEEVIVELPPHPDSDGVYDEYGEAQEGAGEPASTPAGARPPYTVADYFRAQGADPYERAGARYALVLERLAALLHDGSFAPEDPPPLLDVDAAVSDYCEANDLSVPEDVEERVELHLGLLDRWLERSEAV